MKRIALVAVMMMLSVFVFAQTYAAAEVKSDPSKAYWRGSKVIGMNVYNQNKEKIGDIYDIVGGADGKIHYLILAHGGFLSIGEKLIPVPWQAVKPGAEKDTLMVNVAKDKLEKAFNFDNNNWPDFMDPTWDAKVNKFYVNP